MIMTSDSELERMISHIEDCNLEFKKASHSFDSRNLRDYCAALANEKGGKLILGIKEKPDKSSEVCGTVAFLGTHNTLSHDLLKEMGIRVDVEEKVYHGKRVLLFHCPSRPHGTVIRSSGKFRIPMRAGESLCEMDDQTLRTIMNETSPDFSSQPVPTLTINNLDKPAINNLRYLCAKHSRNKNYLESSESQLLNDLGLLNDGIVNYAGILLLGTKETLDNYIPQAEIIFE